MTAIVKGNTYRHRNSTEADMRVISITADKKSYYKLEVIWIMRHTNAWHFDTVTLKKADLKNWNKV